MRVKIELMSLWLLGTLATHLAQGVDPNVGIMPGRPGKDYPVHNEIPKTPFSCQQQPFLGYYADVHTDCQVYHLCQEGGKQTSFLCPIGTIFNQVTHECDEWYHVDCKLSPRLFWRNKYFNEEANRVGGHQGTSAAGNHDATQEKREGSSSGEKISEINDNLRDLKDRLDSSIEEMFFKKPFEREYLTSSEDVEKKLKMIKELLSKRKTQFKEDPHAYSSVNSNNLKNIISEDNIDNNARTINAEHTDKKDPFKKASTAEKLFLLLSYIDKIKVAYAASKMLQDDSVTSSTNRKHLSTNLGPNIGEKLFKILTMLEQKQNASATKINTSNGSINSDLNLESDKDFFDQHRIFETGIINRIGELNKENSNSSKNSFRSETNFNTTESTSDLKNLTMFEDFNISMQNNNDPISDEDAIKILQRILSIKKNISKSNSMNETSLVQELQDNSNKKNNNGESSAKNYEFNDFGRNISSVRSGEENATVIDASSKNLSSKGNKENATVIDASSKNLSSKGNKENATVIDASSKNLSSEENKENATVSNASSKNLSSKENKENATVSNSLRKKLRKADDTNKSEYFDATRNWKMHNQNHVLGSSRRYEGNVLKTDHLLSSILLSHGHHESSGTSNERVNPDHNTTVVDEKGAFKKNHKATPNLDYLEPDSDELMAVLKDIYDTIGKE